MYTTHINKTHTLKGLRVKLCLTNLTMLVKHNLTIFVKHNLTTFVKHKLTIFVNKRKLKFYKFSSNIEVAYNFHTLPCTLQSDPNVLYSQLHFNLKTVIDRVSHTFSK